MSDAPTPLTDADIERLQSLLDAVPAPLEPLDVVALDGYLCGVILQPRPVSATRWLPFVTDVDGQALPPGFDAAELQRLVRKRHGELERAIAQRDWFDPWVFALDQSDDAEPPSETVLPWVAGFAAAQDAFSDLMAMDDPALLEPLALLYLHIPPEDLEDAEALLGIIETIEPPQDLAEAVEDMVRAVMLIADVSRPRKAPPPSRPRAAAVKSRPSPKGKRR